MKHIFTKQCGLNAFSASEIPGILGSMRDVFEVKLATQFCRVKGNNDNMKFGIRNWNTQFWKN